MIRAPFALLVLGTSLAACATAPVAEPLVNVPQSWRAAPLAAGEPPDAYWLAVTQDTTLQGLLTQAGAIDDVAIAETRAREAQALLRAARASLFPTLSADVSAQAARADGAPRIDTNRIGAAVAAPLDLFGGNRARSAAAGARAAAATAELDLARIQARRDVGQLYAALRAAQASRIAAERQARDADDNLSLARTRADAGLESGLAVAQARSAADAARARIPAFAQAETQARLGIEALLGATPGALSDSLRPAPQPVIAAEVLLDAPAAVIARRPDVRVADARLKAAGLDASAARADRFPTATLSAALSRSNASIGLDGATASGGLALAATLFDFGRLQALADAAGARADAEAILYRRTITFAVSAVEREADRLAQSNREALASRAAAASARDQAVLARARYTSGLSSFIDVLLAQRALADAEISLAAAEGRKADAAIDLAAELGLGQQR